MPPHMHSLHDYWHPHHFGIFVRIDEPTLTHRHHPKSIVRIMAHSSSWFSEFVGQIYNDMSAPLEYHQRIVTALKTSCLLPVGIRRWLSGKESACQCRRRKFHPWSGKISWRRKWQPTPVFLPGESQGQRSLAGYIQPTGWQRRQTGLRD